MKLYGSRNSRSLRCVWALEEAGATYDYVRVWMMKGEGLAPWFKAVNPAGKIPVLEDGDLTLTESAAIVHYIAEKFPQSGLLPADLRSRCRSLAIPMRNGAESLNVNAATAIALFALWNRAAVEA